MGEISEMMLSGVLDANGEYTGQNPGIPVYPKGWFGGKGFQSSAPNVNRVKGFLVTRGIPKGELQKAILLEYGKFVGTERPTNHACGNWPVFKAFVDAEIGYVKPSKKQKENG